MSDSVNIPNNLNALKARGKNNLRYVPKNFKKVAKGMEKQFLEYMISQMNETIGRQDKPSTAMDYYRGLMDKERAEIMTEKHQGKGLQEMILNQIYPKKYRTKQNYEQYQKQQQHVGKPRIIRGQDKNSMVKNSVNELKDS